MNDKAITFGVFAPNPHKQREGVRILKTGTRIDELLGGLLPVFYILSGKRENLLGMVANVHMLNHESVTLFQTRDLHTLSADLVSYLVGFHVPPKCEALDPETAGIAQECWNRFTAVSENGDISFYVPVDWQPSEGIDALPSRYLTVENSTIAVDYDDLQKAFGADWEALRSQLLHIKTVGLQINTCVLVLHDPSISGPLSLSAKKIADFVWEEDNITNELGFVKARYDRFSQREDVVAALAARAALSKEVAHEENH